MIGKLILDANAEKLKTYDLDGGKEFVEDLIAMNTLFMGSKWFNLPEYEDLSMEISNRLNKQMVA